MNNVSTINLKEASFGQVDDILVNAEGSTKRITKANFLGAMNDWSNVTNKPFESFDTAYFRTKERADGADLLTFSDSVIAYFQAIGNLQSEVIALDSRTATLESSSHTHDNRAVIDLFSTIDSKLLWNGVAVGSDYELPIATSSVLGGVMPDGTTITIDSDGTIHGASQGLDFDALSTAMTTGSQSGIAVTADTQHSRFNFEVTGIPVVAIDSEGYWTIDGDRGTNPTKAQGERGNDGISPTAVITDTGDGVTITITDKNGTTTADIYDGTDGITPHIDGATKHWFVGEDDTGILAEGITTVTTTSVEFTGVLSANGWVGDTAPYTQTVIINGITADVAPIIDLVVSDDVTIGNKEIAQWSYITKAVTSENAITFSCYSSKPSIAINFKAKVV